MSNESPKADHAAVFGAAVSLWLAAKKRAATEPGINLSESYNGGDEFMRQVMRVATEFELWSCGHVIFEALDDVWPYLLEDEFGEACLSVMGGAGILMRFDERDCLRVAAKLRLPLKTDAGLPVAVDVTAVNPVVGAAFRKFRIQTVRDSRDDDFIEAFTIDDDPFDEEWGAPYFGFYGIEDDDGLLEHIADRATYSDVIELAGKLAPGIAFPLHPVSLR